MVNIGVRKFSLLPVLVLMFVGFGCTEQATVNQQNVVETGPVESIIDETVPIENTTDRAWDQGWLNVSENRYSPNANSIKLPYILSKATDSLRTEGTPTVLIMSGGPGNSSLNMANGVVYTKWGQTHDVLVLEQRGTQYAQPCLNCPEIDSVRIDGLKKGLATDSLFQLKLWATAKCHQRLTTDGIDLAGYNTLSTVEDIETLRQALKLDKLILYGISYSCNLMSAYAQTYPEYTAALIIDSPLPHQANYEEDAFFNVDQTLRSLLLHYTGSNVLYENWIAYMAAIKDSVFAIEFDGKSYAYTRAEMIDLVLFRMSSHSSLPATVQVIENLIEGKHDEIVEVISYHLMESGQALGMRYSVWVSEEVTEENAEEIERQAEAYPWLKGYAINDVTQETGKVWKVVPLYDFQAWPTGKFDGPTLILSGNFDPWTPTSYGTRMKALFPQAKHSVYKEHSHLPGFTENGSREVAAFIDSTGC